MQVYGPSYVHGAQSINAPHSGRVSQPLEAGRTSGPVDEVQISSAGSFIDRINDMPEIRADRVQQIRAAIADGTYLTEHKLDIALDRLLEEIG